MKVLLMITCFFFMGAKNMNSIELEQTDGKKISLKEYTGKPVLIVNIATRCGYTGQLDNLEKVYKEYSSKGLIVLGLPSNDFGGQTPEDNKEVAKFCRLKYGATFPILKKAKVTGVDKHPIIKALLDKTNGKEISWNFEKFLIDKKGNVTRYSSSVKPDSDEMKKAIDAAI